MIEVIKGVRDGKGGALSVLVMLVKDMNLGRMYDNPPTALSVEAGVGAGGVEFPGRDFTVGRPLPLPLPPVPVFFFEAAAAAELLALGRGAGGNQVWSWRFAYWRVMYCFLFFVLVPVYGKKEGEDGKEVEGGEEVEAEGE